MKPIYYAPYYDLHCLISLMDPQNRTKCRRMANDSMSFFLKAPGSTHNHQNWKGGYLDHVVEVMNMAVVLYKTDPRPMPFTLSSALLVLFLHDIEKPWKYNMNRDGQAEPKEEFTSEAHSRSFRSRIMNDYKIILTPEEENALKYVHGEGKDYTPKERIMNPLAAFCHVCDVWVARIRFDHPLENDDPWEGAKRSVRSSK